MTHPELIDALRKSAEKKVATLWDDARAEAEQCRVDAERMTEDQRVQATQIMAANAKELGESAMAAAESEARKIRMATSTALAQRAYRLAREALPKFRDETYEALFAALAEEIPSRAWQRVRVHPADQGLARRHFPDAEIVSDPEIVGGMEVETEDGRIRIDNTLERRLARAWPDVSPGLISDVFKELSDHRSPA